MRRKVFDLLASSAGLVIVVVLLVAGGLLAWGESFTSSSVHNQLAYQQIYFPTKAQILTKGSENYPERSFLLPYAGQEVLNGAQANAYALKIRDDIAGMPYHGVYSKLSAAAMAAKPGSAQATALEAEVATAFKGVTLQGLLLEAYAFSVIGIVMFWAMIAAFCLAFIMAVLVVLGLRHARRTSPEEELLAQPHKVEARVGSTVTA
jgi:hypothetical protein